MDSAMLAGFPALGVCLGYVVVVNGVWRSGVIKIAGRVVNLGILIKRTKKKVENDNFNENALATPVVCMLSGRCL